MKQKYMVVSGTDLVDLSNNVNEALADNWKILGSVVIEYLNTGNNINLRSYHQALMKEV